MLSNCEAYEIMFQIKQHCSDTNQCSNCVFSNKDGDCNISRSEYGISPSEWELNPPTEYKVLP